MQCVKITPKLRVPPPSRLPMLKIAPGKYSKASFPDIKNIFRPNSSAVLCPAGQLAITAASKLKKECVNVVAFADNSVDKHGTLNGIKIASVEACVEEFPDACFLICTSLHDSEIRRQLVSEANVLVYPFGFLNRELPKFFYSREYQSALEQIQMVENQDAAQKAFSLFEDEESRRVFQSKLNFLITLDKSYLEEIHSKESIYFDEHILPLSEEETLADCGAFTGDTVLDFDRATGGRYTRVYAFEPDQKSFGALKKLASGLNTKISCIAAGVSERSGKGWFTTTGSVASRFSASTSSCTDSVAQFSLDDFFSSRPLPTIIKLDVEGFETEALNGAKKIIGAGQTKLAVSVYHRPSDLWRLPILMKSLNPRARIYLRHYSTEIADTVCYSVPF